MIEITDVKMQKITDSSGRTRAIADIIIGDCISINGIKVLQDKYEEDKFFLAMPSKKVGESEYKEFANPTNAKTRQELTELLTQIYNEIE